MANLSQPLLISCFFGVQVRTVYPAPRGCRCIFFSNSPLYRIDAERRGWQFRLVESLPMASSYRQASIQAKYIKFLQFFEEFPDLACYERIIYHDHTIYFRRRDLNWLQAHHALGRPVLVLRHLAKDRTILGEIEAASAQERYAKTMPETIQWLQDLQRESSIRLDAMVDATTIISYRHPELVRPLLNEVYTQTLRLSQPECQIIWSALAQKFPAAVQRVEWKQLDPLWRVPYQARRDRIRHFGRRILNRILPPFT